MDNNLLSGLESLGLGNLEGLDIYEDPHKDEKSRRRLSHPRKRICCLIRVTPVPYVTRILRRKWSAREKPRQWSQTRI